MWTQLSSSDKPGKLLINYIVASTTNLSWIAAVAERAFFNFLLF